MLRLLVLCCISLLVVFVVEGLQCGRKPEQPPWDGNVTERIVGGRDAVPGSWPWQASLQFLHENTTDDFGHTCGCTVIDSRWALTAAHCVTGRMVGLNDSRREEPENFRIVAGTSNLADMTGTQILYLDMIIKHERWEPNALLGYPNDIALLRLTDPVDTSNPNIELACLAQDANFNFTGEECWITGWGLMHFQDDDIPDALQEALIEAISNEECEALNFGYIRESHICAGTGYPNACSGDSGGPMSCFKNQIWYEAGLTSWGMSTCQGIPAVYTRISYYYTWIELQKTLNPPPDVAHMSFY
jgi:secreted trypsin-like serine protease